MGSFVPKKGAMDGELILQEDLAMKESSQQARDEFCSSGFPAASAFLVVRTSDFSLPAP